jgi:anti-sigma factor RsiW
MSPDCIFVLDHYNDYISGELSHENVARVENHTRICPNCEVFLGRAFAMHSRTVGLLRVQAPTSLRHSISALIEKI